MTAGSRRRPTVWRRLLVFAFLHAVPGDRWNQLDDRRPASYRSTGTPSGLDRPPPEQLAGFVGRLARDLDVDPRLSRACDARDPRAPARNHLLAGSVLAPAPGQVACITAAALRPRSLLDVAPASGPAGVALPSVLGLRLVLVFASSPAAPVSGNDGPAHVVLPWRRRWRSA
jgi:hypothetical protein